MSVVTTGRRWFQRLTSPVMFSTLEDNKILKGLMGIPHDGPVLFVGYHMLQGLELVPLIGEFLTHRDVLLRGVAHPFLFSKTIEELMDDKAPVDLLKLFGGVPVSGKNLFRLLSSKSFALLYPGGAREALHRKVLCSFLGFLFAILVLVFTGLTKKASLTERHLQAEKLVHEMHPPMSKYMHAFSIGVRTPALSQFHSKKLITALAGFCSGCQGASLVRYKFELFGP
eukprot:Gb_35044 [translate_table: standard]